MECSHNMILLFQNPILMPFSYGQAVFTLCEYFLGFWGSNFVTTTRSQTNIHTRWTPLDHRKTASKWGSETCVCTPKKGSFLPRIEVHMMFRNGVKNGPLFGQEMGQKMGQKWVKNGSKMGQKWPKNGVFWPILGSKWPHFGVRKWPILCQFKRA